ncbi:hypothetical protein MMC22_008575 [Lobaria immixta]|nr:hypothetical protein [Lobaria immixta]
MPADDIADTPEGIWTDVGDLWPHIDGGSKRSERTVKQSRPQKRRRVSEDSETFLRTGLRFDQQRGTGRSHAKIRSHSTRQALTALSFGKENSQRAISKGDKNPKEDRSRSTGVKNTRKQENCWMKRDDEHDQDH